MRKLSVYLTESHASVTVENGVSRETSGDSMGKVLDEMPPQDRDALLRFCNAVTAYCCTTKPDVRDAAKAALVIRSR